MVGLLIPLAVILYYSELYLRNNEGDESQSYRARYTELFDHRVNASILILGSSNSAHGVVPSLLELPKPVFNFSFNGATCQFNLDFYRDYLKPHYRKPDYLIYALSPNSFSHFWRKIEDDAQYTRAGTKSIFRSLFSPSKLEIFKSSGIGQDIIKDFVREHAPGIRLGLDMRKYDNGYLPYYNGKIFHLMPDESTNADPLEIAALGNLLDELKRDDIRVILVTLPSPYKQYRQADLVAFNSAVSTLAARIQAPVIKADDIAPDFGKDYALFNDDVHLTEQGARIFSKKLGAALRKLINSNTVAQRGRGF